MKLILIRARFRSICPETGRKIFTGDNCYFDVINKRAYHPSADIVRIYESKEAERFYPATEFVKQDETLIN